MTARAGVLPNTDHGHSAYMQCRDVTRAVKPMMRRSQTRRRGQYAPASVIISTGISPDLQTPIPPVFIVDLPE